MRFGLGPIAVDGTQTGHRRLEVAWGFLVAAEEEGFDSIWIEDSGVGGGSPFIAAAALAGITTAVRLCVSCRVGYVHPLYHAEDGAAVDNISNGRLMFAPQDSPTVRHLVAYQVDAAEMASRFWEGVDIIRAAWAPGSLQVSGHHWSIPKSGRVALMVTPKPAQIEVPIWIRTASLQTVEEAARRGLPIVLEASMTPSEVRDAVDRYKATCRAPATIGLIRDVYLAERLIDAEREASSIVDALGTYYQDDVGVGLSVTLESLLWGDVGRVRELLNNYRGWGVEYIICRPFLPGLNSRQVFRSFMLLSRCVMPTFRMINFPEAISLHNLAEATSHRTGYLSEARTDEDGEAR